MSFSSFGLLVVAGVNGSHRGKLRLEWLPSLKMLEGGRWSRR